jgi:arginine exporter protein ArgO
MSAVTGVPRRPGRGDELEADAARLPLPLLSDGPIALVSLLLLLEATLVNILNPNPYLGWTLVLGPAALAAWRERGIHAFALIGVFHSTMCATLAGFVVLVGAPRFLNRRGRRALVPISAALLAGLGLYLLVNSPFLRT